MLRRHVRQAPSAGRSLGHGRESLVRIVVARPAEMKETRQIVAAHFDSTAFTPGALCARERSIDVMRACGYGERTILP